MSTLATDMELHFLRAQVKAQADTIKAYEQVFANAIMKARQSQVELVEPPGATEADPLANGATRPTPGMQAALLENTAAAHVR